MNTIVNDIAYDTTFLRRNGQTAESARKISQEVESLFLHQLIKEMDETVQREEYDIMYGGNAEKTFRSLLHQELAREIARGGGIGLADMIEQQITEQEISGPLMQY